MQHDLSEEQETLQRTRKIIRRSRESQDNSESETRQPPRVKYEMSENIKKETVIRLLSL